MLPASALPYRKLNHMFTLLPEKEKKSLSKEYLWRYLTVAMGAAITSIVLSGIFLLPSYIYSKEKESYSESQLKALQASALYSEENDLVATLKTLQDETTLGKAADTFPTKVMEDVIAHKPTSISITTFQYQYNPTASTLIVSGTAVNRDALTGFASTLSNDPLLASVSYPISDLSANHNIDFTITITGQF